MKLQQTTKILVALALILGGFVFINEFLLLPKQEAIQAKEKQIFDFQEKDIKGVKIETKAQKLELQRTEDSTKPWQMKQPDDLPASDAAVSFLLNLLANGQSDRSFTVSPNELQEYGLDNPLAKIKIQLENEKSHELILGKPNFDNKLIYARVDTSSTQEQNIEIELVKIDFKYAVERKLEDWKYKE